MGLSKMLRFPPSVIRHRGDIAAILALLALTVYASWDLLSDGMIVGMDAATQFYPWYSFLGESLWSGTIPAWNPHQFSGTPFAGDPLSGWTYLPAMLLFTFLPLTIAAKSYVFFHPLFAGLSTYALARSLKMGVPGALLAAVAYVFGGYLYLNNTCCFAYTAVMSWLPLTILGAELAIRNRSWLGRSLWWGVSGLGLSQVLASWLGQGAYYALLALGGYVAYRTLISPPESIRGVRARVTGLFLHGSALLAFGIGLAAAGVLPRLEYNALSNLAGGYPTGAGTEGAEPYSGWSLVDWGSLLEPGRYYAGVTILALALTAPLIARRRFAVPYFAALSLGALVLTGQDTTPLHSALYLLPYFERLHPHTPERIMLIFYLGAALLAGAALTALSEQIGKKRLWLVLPVLAALLLTAVSTLAPPIAEGIADSEGWVWLSPLLSENGVPVPAGPLLALVSTVVLASAYAFIPARLTAWRGLAAALLALVVFGDLLTADRAALDAQSEGTGGLHLDLAAQYRPSGAGQFLQSREEPFRYFGYDPRYPQYLDGETVSSPVRFRNEELRALEVNNRAMMLGLQSLQGYNAVSIARYDEYMKALNGGSQGYHFADVFDGGLDSPLLDLLDARYIIVPADSPDGWPDLQKLEREHPTVYQDDAAKVLENQDALPPAWIVHSARQMGSEEALNLLNSGEVDPKETALLEGAPPNMSQPDDASADSASVTEYDADRIRVKTATGAPGLLVLSEVYYPAWKAYVDGQPVPVQVADQLLRSVPIPAGEHTVELRYESWTLRTGIAISLVACATLVALAIAAGTYRRRETKKEPATKPKS